MGYTIYTHSVIIIIIIVVNSKNFVSSKHKKEEELSPFDGNVNTDELHSKSQCFKNYAKVYQTVSANIL